jgi:hypothetical protein
LRRKCLESSRPDAVRGIYSRFGSRVSSRIGRSTI